MQDTMKILHITQKGRFMNTIEKYHIYIKQSKKESHSLTHTYTTKTLYLKHYINTNKEYTDTVQYPHLNLLEMNTVLLQ
jgi:hypothetical protein